MIIEKNGRKCSCGKLGCIESYCSMKRLKDEIRERKNMQELSSKEIYDIMKNEYVEVEDIISEFIENLTTAMSNYIDIFEPEAITIGGSFVHYKDILYEKLLDNLHKEKITYNGEIPEILLAEFGNDAGMIGAVI